MISIDYVLCLRKRVNGKPKRVLFSKWTKFRDTVLHTQSEEILYIAARKVERIKAVAIFSEGNQRLVRSNFQALDLLLVTLIKQGILDPTLVQK